MYPIVQMEEKQEKHGGIPVHLINDIAEVEYI